MLRALVKVAGVALGPSAMTGNGFYVYHQGLFPINNGFPPRDLVGYDWEWFILMVNYHARNLIQVMVMTGGWLKWLNMVERVTHIVFQSSFFRIDQRLSLNRSYFANSQAGHRLGFSGLDRHSLTLACGEPAAGAFQNAGCSEILPRVA